MIKHNQKNRLFPLRIMLFFLIFLGIFYYVNKIFLYKDSNYYNYINFMMQEENSIDILVMGSSHSINAIDSLELSEALNESGITLKTFNMSVTGMRIEQISYRFEEALKTQKPKYLIIETFSFAPMELSGEEIVRRYALDYMPLSIEKSKLIESRITEKSSFYVPFIKYHTRWKELGQEDFLALSEKWLTNRSQRNGIIAEDAPQYQGETDDYFEQDFHIIMETAEIDADQKADLEHIIELARKNNIKILFLSVPYKVQMNFPNVELIKYNNYLAENYVDNEWIYLLDMNTAINELHWNYNYMQDDGHVNTDGRHVVIDYLTQYMTRNMT